MKSTTLPIAAFSTLALALAFSSCSRETQLSRPDTDRVDARFTGLVAQETSTRISVTDGTSWEQDDVVGIYAVGEKSDNKAFVDVEPTATNKPYIASAGKSTRFTAKDRHPFIYPSDGKAVKFTAYYPYKENVGADYKVPFDVKAQDKPATIDLLHAPLSAPHNRRENGSVQLVFTHKLVKLVFNITNDTWVEEAVDNGITVTISDQYSEGKLDLVSGKVEGSEAKGDLTAEGSKLVTAIVIENSATELAKVRLTFTNKAGKSFTLPVPVSSTPSWDSGMRYTYNVVLSSNDKPSIVSGSIAEWTDGGTIAGSAQEN